jgi:lipopolysaccharide transport system ATP-binding protein
MSDTVIRVENLSKRYVIGHQPETAYRYTTLRDVISDRVKALGRKLRRPYRPSSTPKPEEFWALKDVSFEIKQGEVVGIIGRNGAGKSTLLKVLSRITEPTAGRISMRGRIASLLEVGTGFHPELTGRENIFLNGAILGMGRSEISSKFDEIVDFAEIERFLDTPVKRYSSGMYVRLAFAVAAHLEPEILVIDEVLAVGDIQFQKKCLQKIGNIKDKGQTVIFVSHNMAIVRGMCSRAVLLKEGSVIQDDLPDKVASVYLSEPGKNLSVIRFKQEHCSDEIRFISAYIANSQNSPSSLLDNRESFSIILEYEILQSAPGLRVGFSIESVEGIQICGSTDFDSQNSDKEPGIFVNKCIFPEHILNSGVYTISFGADKAPYSKALIATGPCLNFEVEDLVGHGPFFDRLPGLIKPDLRWSVSKREPATF